MPAEVELAKLPLSRIVLYKHGVGFFERRGHVKGRVNIEVRCSADEIDDMLKSLLVLNVGAGRLSEITYECSKTLETRLAEYGFDIKRCKGLLDLVPQLKGTPVAVTASSGSVLGRVVGIDDVEHIVGDSKVKEQQLVLYTDDCVFKRYGLSSINSIRIEDAKLAEEIKEQLKLLFEGTTKKDAKQLMVRLEEDQERDVIIAYSIPCPIWKTSYRLVFLADGRLLTQGMAIVDNVQDEEWKDVQITLVSAAPISFIQPLYDPIEPWRPTIEAQGVTSAGPLIVERGQKYKMSSLPPAPPMASPSGAPEGLYADEMMAAASRRSRSPQFGLDDESFISVEPSVSTNEAGELFEYRIQNPVTVPANSSALIPIVNEIMEGERISLYSASRNIKHPYATVRLKNTTGLTLESGPVTVVEDDSYAGEGLLDVLKPGDSQFLPYALDQGVHVIVRTDYDRQPIWRVRVSRGFFYMDYRQRCEHTYNLENLADRPKVVYIEHPVRTEVNIVGAEQPVESSQSHHRFRVELAARESMSYPVIEEMEAVQVVRIDSVEAVAVDDLENLLAQNVLDRKFLEFLKVLLQKRRDICDLRETKRQAEAQLAQYAADQQRARDNLKSLGTTNERYRKAIDAAEDRIMETSTLHRQIVDTIARLEREYAELAATELVQELDRSLTSNALSN